MSTRVIELSVVVACLGLMACGSSGPGDIEGGGDGSTNGSDSTSVAEATEADIDASCDVHRGQWEDVDDPDLHDVVCRAFGLKIGLEAAEDDSGDGDHSPREACEGERSFCDSQDTDQFLEQSGWGELQECPYAEFFENRRDEVLEQCELNMGDLEACSIEQRDGFDTLAAQGYDCEVFADGQITDDVAEEAVEDFYGEGETCDEVDECGPCLDDEIRGSIGGEEATCYALCSDEEDCQEEEDCVEFSGETEVCRESDD